MATLHRVARDCDQFGSSTEIFPLSPTLKAGKAVRESGGAPVRQALVLAEALGRESGLFGDARR